MANYIVTDKIRVNIVHGTSVPPRVKCEQYDGDYTRQIEATVYNGDVLYTIPSEVRRIVISGLKPDNTGFSYDCTWSGTKVLFSLMRQMTVVAGSVPCNISFFDGSNNQVSSAVFVLDVEAAALPSDVVVSSNDFQTFVDYVQAANLYWQYSKSYAVGNTGIRSGENTDNSQYYAHLARMYKGSPLTASTISEMIDTERVYVYVGNESGYNNGHWYFYDNTAWTDGGVYNSEGTQTDTELIAGGVAADAKAVGDVLGHEALTTTAQTLSGAVNEIDSDIKKAKWFVTPEEFGAVGDGITDDTDAIQNAINHGVAYGHGLAVILRGVTYKVTRPLTLSNGVRLMGINAKMYAGNFGYTTILAEFADNNKLPILNASSNDEDDYGYTSPGIRNEEIYVSDLTLRGNAFCGIKCKVFSSKFENITIADCKVGIFAFSTFCTYFEKISCVHCEIGMICYGTHSNATIEKCWFNYGLSILNDTNLSQIVNETITLETTKKTGLVVIYGDISIIKSNFEAYYYGVFAQAKSSVYGNGVNVEQICVGGAAFSDSADKAANYFNIKGLTCWNGEDFGGCIADPAYKGIYHIESDENKPNNFADSNFPNRGVLTLNFRNTEKYIDISSIAGITNPVITNNYTRFDKHGNIIVDFVLSNYDNQDLSVAPIIDFANLSDSGFNGLSGTTPIIGTNLRYSHQYRSITNLNGGFVELPKNTRYTFIAKYSPV